MSDSDIELELEDKIENLQPNSCVTSKNNSKSNRFSPYKTVNTNLNSITFPTIMFQTGELTALTKSLPEYFPGSNLSTFVTSVDNLAKFLESKLSPTQTYLFNVSVLAKIKNEARDYLNFHNLTEWPGIREALLRKYGDQRNEELLLSALRNTIQLKHESFNEYYDKILLAQNDLLQFVQLHETDPNSFLFKKHLYHNQSLQIFCSGLLEPYRTYLMNFDLPNLEAALNKCRVYDNKIQENNYTDYVRRLQDYKSHKLPPQMTKNTPTSQNNWQNPRQQTTQSQFQTKQFSQQFQPKQFTQQQPFTQNQFQPKPFFQPQFQPKPFSGSINRPHYAQSRFPTNKQTFGTKPEQQRNQFKPTPMSVQTSAFSTKPRQNQFQSTNKPTFTSQELFNNEVDIEEYPNENDLYYDFEEEQQEIENLQTPLDFENQYEDENFRSPTLKNQQP